MDGFRMKSLLSPEIFVLRKVCQQISSSIDRVIDFIGIKVSWLTTILVVLICTDVFLRYFLQSTKTWILELEWHFFAVLFLIGASYTLQHDKHVRVDLFYEKFSDRTKRFVNIAGMILFLVPWCIVVLNTSWDYFMNSYSFKEGSSQPNGLPARYIIKSFIWTGFMLLLLQGISILIKSILHRSEAD